MFWNVGLHCVIFCYSYQCLRWYPASAARKEEEQENDEKDPEMTKTVYKKVLKIEQKPLTFVRAYRWQLPYCNFSPFRPLTPFEMFDTDRVGGMTDL